MAIDSNLRQQIRGVESSIVRTKQNIENLKQQVRLMERQQPASDRERWEVRGRIKDRARQIDRLNSDLRVERQLSELKRMAR